MCGGKAQPAVCEVCREASVVLERCFEAKPSGQIFELAAQAAGARHAHVDPERLRVGATETPQQGHALLGVGATCHCHCRRVAQPELAPALGIQQALARFDMDSAPLLVVDAARRTHAQQPEPMRARLEPRQGVPEQLVGGDAARLRRAQPFAGTHVDDAITTRRAARERPHQLEPQRKPPPPDLASEHADEAVAATAIVGGVQRLVRVVHGQLAEGSRPLPCRVPLGPGAFRVTLPREPREPRLPDALGEPRLELELVRALGIQPPDRSRRSQLLGGAIERGAQRAERGRSCVPELELAALAAAAGGEPHGGCCRLVLRAAAAQQVDLILRQRNQRIGLAERQWPLARYAFARYAPRLGAVSSMRSVAVHSIRVYDRSYVLAIFTLAYVAVAAIRYAGTRVDALGVLVLGPVALAWVWRRTRLAEGVSPSVHPIALAALRHAAWGAALWLAARTGPAGRPGFDLAANVGLGIALVAAQVALARIPGREGLVRPPPSAHALDAAAFAALLWGCAIALPAVRTFWRGQGVLLDPLATDYATAAASIASVLLLLGAAVRLRHTRRLELGVLDRASGALALCATALSVALPAAVADLAPPDRALPLGALAAALACAWAATTPRATSVATGLRGALVVMLLGAPLALAAAAGAQHVPAYAGVIALGGAFATLVVGILARAVAKPLTAEQSRWLEALEAAARAAREPDPDAAVVATLSALSRVEANTSFRPELWRAEPGEVLTVDVAGYLHTERAAAPAALYQLALEEPERLLRRDVLAALEVRRPEVRPLLGWLDARDALFVVLVSDGELPLGLLSFPKGSRASPLSLEEALAARELCDRLSAVLSLSSSIARSRQRETSARERADELVVETAKLEAIIELRSRPRDYVLDVLASGAKVAAFSARARSLLDALGQRAAAGGDVVLELPAGIDALGYAALVHTAGPRRGGPFVVLDGTEASAHDPARYVPGAEAPIERARGGTLLLLNVASLPLGAQDALAVALSERAPLAAASAFSFVASVARPLGELIEERRVSSALARLLLPAAFSVPALVERPEDLRGLILDALCKSGVRFDGQTLGIDPMALGALIDHRWPGNLRELQSVVERAARAATGERVRLADLEAAGFVPAEEPAVASGATPSSPPRSRRPNASLVIARAERTGARDEDAELGAAEPSDGEPGTSARGVRRRRRR
jgi:DNA-binding NtrC family response regulator